MASHAQSSAALDEAAWHRVGDDTYQIGDQGNATWVRVLELSHRPTWEDLLALGERLYRWIMARWPAYFLTTASGTRLVATLCYAHSEGYTVFQSTIPRGPWRRHLQANARAEAPTWFAAAYSQPPRGVFRERLHAEDSAEFICERHTGTFGSIYEETRLTVYGHEGNRMAGQTNLCDRVNEKNPSCQTVATLLGIRFPPTDVSVRELDEAEQQRRPAPTLTLGPSFGGTGTSTVYINGVAYTADPGSGSTQYYGDYPGTTRTRALQTKVGSSGQGDVGNLSQAMARLRVSGNNGGGGGGGGGKPQTHSRSSVPSSRVSPAKSQARPPATSTARPPATTPARPPTTSQARPATRPSASRTSAAPPAPASRGSTKHGNMK